MRPFIGLTPDEGTSDARPGRPPSARYELKKAYADAVFEAGGLPFVLPYTADDDAIAKYVEELEGLVVTGGAFDIGPELYGEAAKSGLGPMKPVRTKFERSILQLCLDRGIPVLGVCGGMQLLNVVRGGTLIQDIGTEVAGAFEHEQKHDPREPAHEITIVSGSLLERACGAGNLGVNTTHHQAIAKLGRDLRATGISTDGVIEAIEGPDDTFVLGVQWHPEILPDERNQGVYRTFVRAAERR